MNLFRFGRSAALSLLAMGLFVTCWSAPALAQGAQNSSSASTTVAGAPQFAPTLSLMGSMESNPYRISDTTNRTNLYAVAAELPFQIRSKRWTLDFRYRPSYRYYREDDTLTSFDHAGSLALRGALSRRTQLDIEGDVYASNELQGLDATEIVLPRTRQVRGEIDVELTHELTRRDSISFSGRYAQLMFPDGELIDNKVADFGVGYGRAVSTRVTATLTGGLRWSRFDNGTQARSAALGAGGRFQLGRYTRLDAEAGVLWIQQDLGLGPGFGAAGRPEIALRAALRHQVDQVSFDLVAGRDMGTRSGLGQATLRDRITGSVGWSNSRLNFLGLAGYARNSGLESVGSVTPAVQTVSACGSAAVRVNRVLAIVGSALYSHQVGELIDDRPVTDTFRVALGIRLQANGPSLSSASSSYSYSSLLRSARASC
jgi:hypothetical protein